VRWVIVSLGAAAVVWLFLPQTTPPERCEPSAPPLLPSPPHPPPLLHLADIAAWAEGLGAREPEARWESTLALVRAGPPAVRPLLQRLARSEPFAWEEEEWEGEHWIAHAHAKFVLDRIGEGVLPGLLAALGEDDLRCEALRALGRYGAQYDGALDPLVAALDTDPVTAAFALGRMGSRAAPAAERLAELLGDEDNRWAAADVLPALGADAVPAIAGALRRAPNGRLVGNLHRLREAAAPLVPILADLVGRADPVLQRDVVWGLRAMGPVARDAVPALLALQRDAPEAWPTTGAPEMYAIRAVLDIGTDPETEERLLARLQERGDADDEDRARLREVRGGAPPVVHAREERAPPDPDAVRTRVAELMGELPSPGAAYALANFGPAAAAAAPALAHVLLGPERVDEEYGTIPWEYEQRAAARALWSIGAVPCAPGRLLPRLESSFEVRAPVALLLWRNGRRDPELLPVLVEAVRPVQRRELCGYRYERPAYLRTAAIDALAAAGVEAAIPGLHAGRDDRDDRVAAAARRALAALETH